MKESYGAIPGHGNFPFPLKMGLSAARGTVNGRALAPERGGRSRRLMTHSPITTRHSAEGSKQRNTPRGDKRPVHPWPGSRPRAAAPGREVPESPGDGRPLPWDSERAGSFAEAS
jgi:hypothetical protein